MAARSTIEERLASVEARMSALDHLPAQVNRLESEMREMHAELLERIEDARRETRVLHEDALGRIAVIGEGLTTLSERADYQFIQLTGFIDASRTEMRETLAQILTRLDTPQNRG